MEDLGHFVLPTNGSSSLKIAQFTDLHHFPKHVTSHFAAGRMINFEAENYSSRKTIELIRHVVEHNPDLDLAIFTGDIIDGRPFKNEDPKSFMEAFSELLVPLNGENNLKKTVPWIYLPGNHDDDESPWTRKDLLELFSLPGALTPRAAGFNFTFTVSKVSSKKVRLWIFDSGGNHEIPRYRYHTFDKETVQAYEKLSAALKEIRNEDEYNLGLAYFHIPMPEYNGLDPVNGVNG